MNYIVAREEALTIATANFRYEHNERKNKTYLNKAIDLSKENYHFKKPDKSYIATFHEMAESGLFSTRKVPLNQKETAIGSEIIVAVAGSYFQSEEEAIKFYKVANDALNQFFSVTLPDGTKVDGKDLCISSVVHLDEGSYGLHYTTVTCVPRELKKRRTKKEMAEGTEARSGGWYCQLSHSGFWQSEKDDNGKLYYSYSKLNDIIAEAYKEAGYSDIERGQKGSTQKHLHPNEFKALMNDIKEEAKESLSFMDAKKIAGRYVMDEKAYNQLLEYQEKLNQQYAVAQKSQEIIDYEREQIREERRKVKKKQLLVEKIMDDNAGLADKYDNAKVEIRKKQADIEARDKEIVYQKEIIDFFQRIYSIIIEAVKKILEWIDDLLNGELSSIQQEQVQRNIDTTYKEMLSAVQTVEEVTGSVKLADAR